MAYRRFLHVNERDNTVIALDGIPKGEKILVDGQEITAVEDIPVNHKIALEDIPKGGALIKYGESIGVASASIPKGAWVHGHVIEGSVDREQKFSDSFTDSAAEGGKA